MTQTTNSETPTSSSPAVAHTPHGQVSAGNNVVIWLLLVSAFVVILNETIMSVAITPIGEAFTIGTSTAQWLTTAFMLTMAVVIPLTGFLIQRFNLRPLFMTAMGLFTVGTVIAAAAPLFPILVVGRIVQASGTGIMMPLLMTTVMTLVPAQSRGAIMGRISIVISVAPALGPMVSGFILQAFDWRFIFIFVIPLAIAALVLGAFKLKNVTETRPVGIDWWSVVLSAFAFGGLIFGLSSIGEAARGEALMQPWIPITVGAVAFALFVWRQLVLQRDDRALLDLRTFKAPIFTMSIVMFVVSMMAMFGTIILLPIYAQDVLGLAPAITGLLILPGGLIMAGMGPIVGRIYDRRGARILVVPGAIIVSAVLWSFTLLSTTTPPWLLGVSYAFLSIGLALMFTPLFSTSLSSLRPHLYSHGSAILGTVQQLAGALGTAIFVTLLTIQTQALASTGSSAIEAEASGVRLAFLAGGVISLVGVGIAFFIKKPIEEEWDGEEAPSGMHAGH